MITEGLGEKGRLIMKVIGLTGGIGSGKSTVSGYMAELGAVIIDADKVGHEAFKQHTAAWHDVVKTFGNDVLASDGEIDRAKLSGIVFNNPEALKKLNSIMHPRMKQMVKTQIENYLKKGVKVVVVEAYGLIEADWVSIVDEVWVTVSSESVVLERLKKQRGLDEKEILARIHSQLSSEERVKAANVVIYNDGKLEEMEEKVRELWAGLQ